MDTFATTDTVYAHSKKREEWGYAILAFESDDRRGFQFQDGRLRVFKIGYYELLEPVLPKPDGTPRIVSNLKAMLAKTVDERVRPAKPSDKPALGFDAFVTVAKDLFPEGFKGDEYDAKVRGSQATRRLKRHRDAAIEDARERLGKASFGALTPAAARDMLRDVLKATDLVNAKQLAPIDAVPSENLEELQASVLAMLYGTGPYEARFERFAQALEVGGNVSWELATTPGALVHPDEHLWIKVTPMKRFLARFSPVLSLTPRVTGFTYTRLVAMGASLVEGLNNAGFEASDFFDIAHLLTEITKAPSLQRLDAMAVPEDDD
ncbi:MAG: hypothetical protein JRH11_06080 [Deltaproteobacteria bacterium]|nr:hypothetical protein [Deltaproteobacteria bacterium]